MKQTPFFFGFNHTLTRANYEALKQVAKAGETVDAALNRVLSEYFAALGNVQDNDALRELALRINVINLYDDEEEAPAGIHYVDLPE